MPFARTMQSHVRAIKATTCLSLQFRTSPLRFVSDQAPIPIRQEISVYLRNQNDLALSPRIMAGANCFKSVLLSNF